MSESVSTSPAPPHRRVVLVDFDWRDADLLPELLARPGLAVRLVAGGADDDAGLRMAELCELPRTTDLADLTREIFDLAVLGERSPRRAQVEGLMLALGTPCVTPEALLRTPEPASVPAPADGPPLAVRAAAFESALGGADFEALLEQALPDVAAGSPAAPPRPAPAPRAVTPLGTLEGFPSLEDRQGLERALADLVATTGAQGAEVRAARAGDVDLVARVGGEDPLLAGLIGLALDQNAAQVVSRLSGPEEGKAWGAWPFRTTRSRGVVAAAAIDPASGWTAWQHLVDDLRESWDQEDRAQAAPAFPLVPEARQGWLDAEAFRSAVSLAVERNRRDGLPFAVHRFLLADRPGAPEALCERLPSQLRDTDRLCRPAPHVVLLLTSCTRDAFEPVRRRVVGLWEAVWRQSGGPAPAPDLDESRTAVNTPADEERFVRAVEGWLAV
jgi:hypothetical protein